MAKLLTRRHLIKYAVHDLEVMILNPSRVELRECSTSVEAVLETKELNNMFLLLLP